MVDLGRIHLPGDMDDWRAGGKCFEEWASSIGRANTRAGDDRRQPARRARKAIGHGRGAMLRPRRHDAHAPFTGDRVENGQVVDADDAERGVHFGRLEAIDDQLATRALHPA